MDLCPAQSSYWYITVASSCPTTDHSFHVSFCPLYKKYKWHNYWDPSWSILFPQECIASKQDPLNEDLPPLDFRRSNCICTKPIEVLRILGLITFQYAYFYGSQDHRYDCFPMGSNYIYILVSHALYIHVVKEVTSYKGLVNWWA